MAMVTYPLNNIEFSAEDAELYNSTRTSGVYDAKSDFDLSLETGLFVTVTPGIAWIKNAKFKGKVVALKENETITLPDPPATFPRYDVIAIQFDALRNKSSIVVKMGDTVGWNPELPVRSISESLYELFLYSIYRDVNSYEITEENVKDLRNDPNYCGVMVGPVTDAVSMEEFNKRYPFVESETHPGCYYKLVDGEQEWLNPPMEVGTEYRTAKRYKGKPVYTYNVHYGPLPKKDQSTDFDVAITNFSDFVSWNISYPRFDGLTPLRSNDILKTLWLEPTPYRLRFMFTSSIDMVNLDLHFVIEYTKD